LLSEKVRVTLPAAGRQVTLGILLAVFAANHINLHRLWLQRGRESLPRILHGAVNAERAAIEFPIEVDQDPIFGWHVVPGTQMFLGY
jgi:hypothetical protein